MILVKAKIKPSKVHGLGLFADEFIPKGTHVWKFVPEFDGEYKLDIIEKLSNESRRQFMNYAYVSKKKDRYILCTDDMRFINHSDNNNIENIDNGEFEGVDVAIKDIQIGEEMLYNYNAFREGTAGF